MYRQATWQERKIQNLEGLLTSIIKNWSTINEDRAEIHRAEALAQRQANGGTRGGPAAWQPARAEKLASREDRARSAPAARAAIAKMQAHLGKPRNN